VGKHIAGEVRRRLVWRVTASAPQGEYVDPDAPQPRIVRFDRPEPGWLQSSFDLAVGLDVHEGCEPIPPEVFDALFRRS
jgi:hypothetical protein